MKYLEENVAASDVSSPTRTSTALETAVPRDAVAGDRYGDMSPIDAYGNSPTGHSMHS